MRTDAYTFASPVRENPFGGWARTVLVGAEVYTCSVTRGKAVRIPYKRRGKNRGYRWNGSVYSDKGRVWQGDVPGSIGCKGLLECAGLIPAKAEGRE